MFTLEHKGKRVDLSSTVSPTMRCCITVTDVTIDHLLFLACQIIIMSNFEVRFSGIPNNGTLELVELSQEEIGKEEKVRR